MRKAWKKAIMHQPGVRRKTMSVEEAAESLGLSRDWLYNRISGRTAIAAADDELFWEKALDRFDLPDSAVRERPGPYGQDLLGRPKIPVGFPMAQVRYAGQVPCGSEWGDPLASEEFVEVEAQFEGPRRFAAKVVGDSCYPALLPGDLTIWEQDFSPPYGAIVLAQRKGDHGCTVKQLTHDGQRPHLTPVNPAHKEPADQDGWGVVARLVAVLRPGSTRRTWFSEHGIRPRDMTE